MNARLSIQIAAGAALLVGVLPSSGSAQYQQNVSDALAWLEQEQALDGSWGGEEAVRLLYTSEVVVALQSLNRRDPLYYRGIAWLENHATANSDYASRQVRALVSHGDDVSPTLDLLLGARRAEGTSGIDGWGVSRAYAASPLDTALVLEALAEAGSSEDVSAVLAYVKAAQLAGGTGGWPAVAGGTSQDSIVTSYVVRALLRYVGVDPTLAARIAGAVSTLEGAVDTSSPVLVQAHAALALLQENPASAKGAQLVQNLATTLQGPDGSWNQNPYETAVALRAIAQKMGLADPALSAPVFIADPELRQLLNLALGRSAMDRITRGELQRIEQLAARGAGIADLTGLEEATNLTSADLRDNAIEDCVSPLAGLTALTDVALQGNPCACDLNGDGLEDSIDGLLLLRMVQGAVTPTALDVGLADIAPQTEPGDGELDSADALLLLRAIAGHSVPPCGEEIP